MALNMEMLEKMPMQQKVLALAALIITLGALFYYFVENKKGKEIKELNKTECDLKTNVAKLVAIKAKKTGLENWIKDAEQKKKSFQQNLPSNMEMESLLGEISRIAEVNGIKFSTFNIGKPNPMMDLYVEVPIDLKFTGNFFYAMDFFYKVTHLRRIVTFRGVQIKAAGPKSKEVEVACILSIYKYVGR